MVDNNRPLAPEIGIPQSFEEYRVAQRGRQLEDLKRLLSFASVSADPGQAEEIAACAAWVRDHLERIGLEGVRSFETAAPASMKTPRTTNRPTIPGALPKNCSAANERYLDRP